MTTGLSVRFSWVLLRLYMEVMEKKMETTVMGYIGLLVRDSVLTERADPAFCT